MAWIWMLSAAGVVLLWAISLGRILSSPTPSCLPPSPHFLAPFRGDRRSRNVLLVIAHPDDESMYALLSLSDLEESNQIMGLDLPQAADESNPYYPCVECSLAQFFSPTILFLKSKGHNIHILCMSQGNADGLGITRHEEMYHACDTLKVPREQVKVLDHPKLQDGFHEKWDHGLLAELTMEQVQLWEIDTIVTFDSYGVSGHPNHQDIHHGIRKFLHENGQGNIESWELESLNILRKYIGPVDIWLSSLISFSSSKQSIFTIVNNSPARSYQAMAAHRSQWV
ncbi:hypothetical protein ACP70R_010552 [Stipagrostis hirtigluma subsp. patula]